MSKLKYGPRFRSGAVSVGCRYSRFLDKVPLRFRNMTPKQRAFAAAKQSTKVAKKRIVGMPKFSWDEKPEESPLERMTPPSASAGVGGSQKGVLR